MDYYSGGNGESSYSNLNGTNIQPTGFSNKFRDNSSIVLIIMAMIIVALIAGYLVYGINHENASSGPDTNSSLSSLSVDGGTIEPRFDSKITQYTIYLDENNNSVSFTCDAASSKSKVDNCDVVDMSSKNKVEHVIKVTAEDTSVTRYYFTVIRRQVLIIFFFLV